MTDIRMQPTEYQNLSLTTSASVVGENELYLQRLLTQVSDTDAMLQRLREEQYAARESVFDVKAADAVEALPSERVLPDRKLEVIEGTVNAQWEMTYRSVVYDKDRGGGPYGSEMPSGRLDWNTAIDTFRENNRGDSRVIEWAADSVEAHTSDGQMVLDLPLANGETMQVLPNEDISDWLDDVTEVRLAWYPTRERAAIGELSDVEPEEVELTLGSGSNTPRCYVEREGPDSEVSASHDQLLENCSDPYADDGEMEVVVDIIRTGYFSKDEQLRYLLFLAGEQDVVRVNYGYSVPHIIDKIADALDAHLTHIPQTGQVLLSREPLSEFEHLAGAFTEKQTLDDTEEREIRETLGQPESSIEFVLNDDSWGARTIERVAQLFDAGVLTETDVFVYQFSNYMPAPTEEAIFSAVQDGTANLATLDEFDAAYGTSVGTDIRREVSDYGYLVRNDW